METITLNRNVKLKNGGRKAMKMDLDTFIKKYLDWCKKHYDDVYVYDEPEDKDNIEFNNCYTIQSNGAVKIDENQFPVIQWTESMKFKIKFSRENFGIEKIGMTSTGIPYIAIWYGGDWEIPLLVFYYVDNNGKLTNYIPTYGNSFNPITKTACNSEDEYNVKNYDDLVEKYLPNLDEDNEIGMEWLKVLVSMSGYTFDWEEIDVYNDIFNNIEFNFNMCLKDFESRVTI